MMSRTTWVLLAVCVSACQGGGSHQLDRVPAVRSYPVAPRVDVVDELHGVEVRDPYRWLESVDAPQTRDWMEAQEALLDGFVSEHPEREEFEYRVLALQSYDRRTQPFRQGTRTFYSEIAAGERQGPLLVLEEGDSEPQVALDPQRVLPAGTSLGGTSVSWLGHFVAFAVNAGEADVWATQRVLEVDTGRVLEDRVEGLWGGATWTHDEAGFFYTRFELPADLRLSTDAIHTPRIYYHRLGTPQSDDLLVYETPERPDWLVRHRLTHDGRTLVVRASEGSSFGGLDDQVFLVDLTRETWQAREFLPVADGRYGFEGSEGDTFWFRTSVGAERNRLVAIERSRPEPEHWKDLIAERPGQMMWVSVFADRFVAGVNRDAVTRVEVFDRGGRFLYEVNPGSVSLLGGFGDDPEGPLAYYSASNLFDPGTIYELDTRTGESRIHWRPALAHDPDDFELRQVFYTSSDGTRVPMFVAGLAGSLDEPEPAPLFMYAYGALGWSAFPWYQPALIAWMERGGRYAMPSIRGGGEYGEAWREAGILTRKQTGIDDYLAAAEFLIDEGFTSPSHLVANGGSASGVLPAAAALQRPDLFAAALVDIPKLDMLRYHLFTGSAFTVPDFGSVEDLEEFRALLAYSPYHNVRDNRRYPAFLVVVGEQDTTSPPLHGYKFVARLQASNPERPAMLKIVRNAGHTYGATPQQGAETWGDVLSFLYRVIGPGV